MEKQNTLKYVQGILESELDFNGWESGINTPNAQLAMNILQNCMADNERKAYYKALYAKYNANK